MSGHVFKLAEIGQSEMRSSTDVIIPCSATDVSSTQRLGIFRSEFCGCCKKPWKSEGNSKYFIGEQRVCVSCKQPLRDTPTEKARSKNTKPTRNALREMAKSRRASWMGVQPYFGILLGNPIYDHYYNNREPGNYVSKVGSTVPLASSAQPKWRHKAYDVMFEADQVNKSVNFAKDYWRQFSEVSDDLVNYYVQRKYYDEPPDYEYREQPPYPLDDRLDMSKYPRFREDDVDPFDNTYKDYTSLLDSKQAFAPVSSVYSYQNPREDPNYVYKQDSDIARLSLTSKVNEGITAEDPAARMNNPVVTSPRNEPSTSTTSPHVAASSSKTPNMNITDSRAKLCYEDISRSDRVITARTAQQMRSNRIEPPAPFTEPYTEMNKPMTGHVESQEPDYGFEVNPNRYEPMFEPDNDYTYTRRNESESIKAYCHDTAIADTQHSQFPQSGQNSARSNDFQDGGRPEVEYFYQPEMTIENFREKMPLLGEKLIEEVYSSYLKQESQMQLTRHNPLFSNVRKLVPFIDDNAVKFAYLRYIDAQSQLGRHTKGAQVGGSLLQLTARKGKKHA